MEYYSAEEIRAALGLRELIYALKEHMTLEHKNSPRLVLNFKEGKALGAMLSTTGSLLGGKLVAVFPENPKQGLNPHQGLVVLLSPQDGRPTQIFDASEITGLRTAALSAAATETLANETDRLVIFGTGHQAYLHARSICEIHPISQIRVVGRDFMKVSALCSRLEKELSIAAIPTGNSNEALREVAIICLCTAATHPYIREDDIPSGSHINAIGACRPGMREIELAPVTNMEIYVDDLARVQEEASELEEQTNLRPLANARTPSRGKTTLFKSVGTGILDLVAADLVRRKLS